jgi:hypothetical protein
MRNEEFLILAYIVVAVICVFMGLAAWIFLRDPVRKIADRIPHNGWGETLKRSYPAGILLSALAGFLSVSYFSCQNKSYEEVISKAHVISISSEQISESVYSIALAVFLGAIVILMSLLAIRRSGPKP